MKDIAYVGIVGVLAGFVICLAIGFISRILWGFVHIGWVVGGLVTP